MIGDAERIERELVYIRFQSKVIRGIIESCGGLSTPETAKHATEIILLSAERISESCNFVLSSGYQTKTTVKTLPFRGGGGEQ